MSQVGLHSCCPSLDYTPAASFVEAPEDSPSTMRFTPLKCLKGTVILTILSLFYMKYSFQPRTGLKAHDGSFYMDDRPFRILSGSFHYFRTHPEQWLDRLEKMKAAGLNAISTYIPWNLHEEIRGEFQFEGFWNLLKFIELVQSMGLYMIARPGPYICAEWEQGGFPAWMLHDPYMTFRSSKYPMYLKHVERYFNQLLPILARYTYKRGGPIIAVQVENEFGNLRTIDEAYIKFIVNLYHANNINELLFTSDSSWNLDFVEYPGLLPTVNFADRGKEHLQRLKIFNPGMPLMVGEFWSGWFDQWGKRHSISKKDFFEQAVDDVLSMQASINVYMFVGGTNFGFWNGANADKQIPIRSDYRPTRNKLRLRCSNLGIW